MTSGRSRKSHDRQASVDVIAHIRTRDPDDGQTSIDMVTRIRNGDVRAFEQLYLEYFQELWLFAYRFVRSADDAEDIVQDVFSSLWAQRVNWVVHTTIRGYLYASVRKRSITRYRHETLVSRVTELATSLKSALGTSGGPESPDAYVTANDETRALERAIRELPERQQTAFLLRWKGQEIAEIAEVMGVSVVAVRKLLGKAILRLEKTIG